MRYDKKLWWYYQWEYVHENYWWYCDATVFIMITGVIVIPYALIWLLLVLLLLYALLLSYYMYAIYIVNDIVILCLLWCIYIYILAQILGWFSSENAWNSDGVDVSETFQLSRLSFYFSISFGTFIVKGYWMWLNREEADSTVLMEKRLGTLLFNQLKIAF